MVVPVIPPTATGPKGTTAAATQVQVAGARRPHRRGRIAALVVLVLALAVGLGGWYLGSGRYTDTPSVLGLSKAAAVQRLQGVGLTAKEGPAVFDDRVANGLVLRQEPSVNGRIRKGGSVTIVLSKGVDLRAVPKLQGLSRQGALDALSTAGLAAGQVTEAFSSAVPGGQVISSDPATSTRLRPRATVSFVLSKGVELLPVPDVQNKAQAEAGKTLQDAGFRTTVTMVFSDTVPAGVVTDQSPSQGTAPRGSVDALVVSKGPDLVTVPKLSGLTTDEAKAQLAALGLNSKVRSIPGPGIVRDQDPSPGSKVRKGSTVTLFVF